MATSPPSAAASPLFLREEEIRRGIELLHFGHGALTDAMDGLLARHGLGHAHQRTLYFVARRPDLSVSALIRLLGITKQSLGRVLDDLTARGFIQANPSTRDRRQRLLRLTPEGEAVERALFDVMRERMATAYSTAGQGSVTGYWRVLENLLTPEDQRLVAALQIKA